MSYNHEDVKCPYCDEWQRIAFQVNSVPFGQTTISACEPNKCYKCNEYFVGKVETIYTARKLTKREQIQLEKKGRM